jgi:hypothetical protein
LIAYSKADNEHQGFRRTQEMHGMVIIGSLRLITGLAFLGTVIASCLWLLNRLFPDTSDTSYRLRNDASQDTLPAQQTTATGEREPHEASGVAQKPEPPNDGEVEDERITK